MINFLEIIEQRTAGVDERQKAATAMVIFRVGFEMLSQVENAGGEDCDLNFGGTCIAFVAGVFLDQLLFALSSNCHVVSFDIGLTD